MEMSVVIFVLILLSASFLCILIVRDSMKRNIAARRERDRTFPAQPRVPLTPHQRSLIQARAEARKQEAQRRAEVWKNMSPSLVNEAFRNFYREDKEASLDASHVNAAFEKFTEEMDARQ